MIANKCTNMNDSNKNQSKQISGTETAKFKCLSPFFKQSVNLYMN